MKNCVVVIFMFLVAAGCTKEVGKEPYELVLSFDAGGSIPFTVFVYEKAKNYDNGNVAHKINTKKQTNSIYIESIPLPGLELVLLKKDKEKLIGLSRISAWKTTEISFASGQEVSVEGFIEMDGNYTKKGKKFTVSEGSFTITWNNSADYGEPSNKEISGVWSMNRK